ncbi:hypothetical protein AX16_003039 [Volvariella volvacea WC 439]|nr:hypothetical protein AX16_003039 [Volvariella volvacea WC 439]
MDDIAHELPFNINHRKRKASPDDHTDPPAHNDSPRPVPPEAIRVDTSVAVPPTNAPRQPWLAPDSDNAMWPSPTSPQVSSPLSSQVFSSLSGKPSKRPRLDKHQSVPSSPVGKRLHKKPPSVKPKPPPTARLGSDLEDIGIIPQAEPGPSSGSLLNLREAVLTQSIDDALPSSIPFDINSAHIPPLQPLINRQTLKELDLDSILRNPQLRHDILFDPGLQFRPTSSRRKRELADRYWAAITQELESGCTCMTFDNDGKLTATICICAQAQLPPSNRVVALSQTHSTVTLRLPSRIRNLLSEFLEVLLLVIQPLSNMSGMYVNPNTFKAHMQEHSAQAAYIRSVFDPELIEQELKHNQFDPSGLFTAIGTTLKGHCAPMRDRAVELMVQAAQSCAPGGSGTKTEAVRAVRMCMELLELMKLDIANHQLQTLRPFLIRTSGQFELKTFRNRKGSDCSLRITKEWLRVAHKKLLTRTQPIPHPLYPSEPLLHSNLHRNQQAYLATLCGLVDLVFEPPAGASHQTPPPPSLSQSSLPSIVPLPGYPETSYLDSARLLLLSTDAAELTSLHMFLLLYRQLVSSDMAQKRQPVKIDDAKLLKLKNEIIDIGSSRLGHCFFRRSSAEPGSRTERKEIERWRSTKRDIVLQVATRAKEALDSSSSSSFASASTPALPQLPDEQMLNTAHRWADTNIQAGSTLSIMLRDRLRDQVFNTVVALAYPGRSSTSGQLMKIDFLSFGRSNAPANIPSNPVPGMEPLAEEIRILSEKIARQALIHLNAFLPLYEQDAFWDS